ncbi:hypothetical protein BH11PSE12_BH11PSE12_06000 [soil metagenome]
MKLSYLAGILGVSLLGMAGQVGAHGDEDHTQDKPAATAAPAAPAGVGGMDGAAALRLADGSLFVPKVVQRQLALRTVLTELKELPATVILNGKVLADPNAGGRVQASQPGRIEAGPQGLPVLGQKVAKGQVLAYLRPVASSIERGNSQAQLAELESQVAITTRQLQRYEQLEGAIPQAIIEATRLELGALKKRLNAVGGGINTTEALTAPASGIISASSVVVGQVVESKEILFEVIDPARLTVEALAYDTALVADVASATAAADHINNGAGILQLQFVGAGRQLREQALPLLFRIQAASSATVRPMPVAVGQSVKVIVKTARTVKGVALPLAALMKVGAGENAVWVHTGAERFVLRKVQMQALDAAAVVVTAGLANGERVLTEGASLLAQVR